MIDMDNGCTASRSAWLRSPNVGNSNNVNNVNSSGTLNNNNANNANGCVPDRIFCPEKVSPETGRNQCTFIMQGAVVQSPEITGKTHAADAVCFVKNDKQVRLPTAASFSAYRKSISFGELYRAAGKCANGVRWKESVQEFVHNRLVRTLILKRDLENGTYKLMPYIVFMIYEPKQRKIISTRFRDRVFQRSMCDNGMYHQITKSFIYDNCACIKGRGTDYALRRLSVHLHEHFRKYGNTGWVLKLDVKKYFPSIPHSTAKKAMEKRISDPMLLYRMFEIIDSFPDDRMPIEIENDPFGKRSIALGSQVSQLVALAVLDDIDHYIKEQLKIRHYVRYMDDFILVDKDREKLRFAYDEINRRLNLIGCTLNKKSNLFPLKQGIVFLKFRYRFTKTGKLIKLASHKAKARERKKLQALKRQIEKGKLTIDAINEHFQSWKSHMDRGNTYGLVRDMRRYARKLFQPLQGGENVKCGHCEDGGRNESRTDGKDDPLSGGASHGKQHRTV